MEKAVTRLDFHPSVLLLFFFVIQHLVDKTQDKLLISSATLCNKPFNPVCYFFIRNCTRSQYLVKRCSNGKNQPDQNIQTWFSPVIFYCREKTRADICPFCNLFTGIFSLFSCASVRETKGINGLLFFLSHAPSPHIIVLYLDCEVFKMIYTLLFNSYSK
mgnify:CR=1 FL=1